MWRTRLRSFPRSPITLQIDLYRAVIVYFPFPNLFHLYLQVVASPHLQTDLTPDPHQPIIFIEKVKLESVWMAMVTALMFIHAHTCSNMRVPHLAADCNWLLYVAVPDEEGMKNVTLFSMYFENVNWTLLAGKGVAFLSFLSTVRDGRRGRGRELTWSNTDTKHLIWLTQNYSLDRNPRWRKTR